MNAMVKKSKPRIARVPQVLGRSILLRDVQPDDAEFILMLRLDPRKNRYLSPVVDDVDRQREWIHGYLQSEGQAYFIICALEGEPLGTVRLYDAMGDSFSWGSWILKDGAPASAAVETAVLVYSLGLHWGFRRAHFQVHQGNGSVLAFHERFGARRTAETEEEVHLAIDEASIRRSLDRYANFLPEQLQVE